MAREMLPKYHCDACETDLSDLVRIKCAQCDDFDLCAECFAQGVELNGHRCDHPYRVVVCFPAFPNNILLLIILFQKKKKKEKKISTKFKGFFFFLFSNKKNFFLFFFFFLVWA
jgi:hypothetical protein